MDMTKEHVPAERYAVAHYRAICRVAGEAARLKAARRSFRRTQYR